MASFFSSPNVSKGFGSTPTSTNTGAASNPFAVANTTGNTNTSTISAPSAVAWTIPFGNSNSSTSSTTPQQTTSTTMTNNTNPFATSTQPVTTSTSAALPSGSNNTATTATTGAAPAPFSFTSTSSLTSGNNNTNISAPNAFGNVQNTFGSTSGVATATATGTTNMFGNNTTGGGFGSGFGFGANVVSNNNSTQQPQFSFQQPQNASLNAAAGGVAMNTPFGVNNTNTLYSNSSNNNMICNWQDYNKQSALASYLFEFDKAYDAFHSSCHFRGFVYNKCNSGQAQAAIQKDRYIAHIHGCFDLNNNNNISNNTNNIYSNSNSGNEGTGATVEQYMCAINANPDKNNTYPAPVHFMQELEHRTDKQKEAIKSCHEQVANIHSQIQHLQEIQDRNDTKATAIRKRQQALQTRWLRIVRQVELLRKWHQPFNPQEMLMNKRVGEMHSLLFDAGGVNETLNELKLYLQKEATQLLQGSKAQSAQGVTSSSASTTPIITSTQQRSVTNTPNPSPTNVNYSKHDTSNNIMMKLSVPLLYSDIHPELMRAWLQLTQSVQHTIESLYNLLQHDLNEMTAIRKRVMLEQ